MVDPRVSKEAAYEVLHGPGLQYLFNLSVKEHLDEMKQQLLTNRKLTEGERLGFIIAREALIAGFSDMFAKLDVRLPNWLEQEQIL